MRVPVKNWKGMLVGLCTHLYAKHGDDFSQKVLGLGGRTRTYFSRNPSDMRLPEAIGESGIYVGTHWSADDTYRRCKQVVKVLGYAANRFEVELAESGRRDVRRRGQPRESIAPAPPVRPARAPSAAREVSEEPQAQAPVGDEKPSIRQQIVAHLNGMADREFEHFVGHLLAKLQYENVEVVGRSGDGGVDVTCILKGPLLTPPVTIACQVKRHSSNIGPGAVGDLRGRWAHRADRLILVNTGGFTQGAREAASEPGAKEIALVSGDDLAELMIERAIGVTKQPVVTEKLDEAFFGQFSV
jgi:restriction endonuclease Mrr